MTRKTRFGTGLARFGVVMLGVVAMAWQAGCQVNAATGRSQFLPITTQQEIALGTEAMGQLTEEYGGEVSDRALQQYVTEIGLAMAAKTEGDNPDLPWEFTLLDSDVINAFALPGGKVFMSRGLAERMTNEAQLAGVLGHEIGHVTARHVGERIGQSMGMEMLIRVAGAVANGSESAVGQYIPAVLGYGGQGYLLKFGRDQELESDALGMRYMTRAGYDPVGQRQVMEILAEASSGARQPEFLSTHPHPESRIGQIDQLLATEYRDLTGVRTFEGRFKRKFLNRISQLPPAPDTGRGGVLAAAWCSVCAEGGTH